MIQDWINLSYGLLLASIILSISGIIIIGAYENFEISSYIILISIVFWTIALVIGVVGWIL